MLQLIRERDLVTLMMVFLIQKVYYKEDITQCCQTISHANFLAHEPVELQMAEISNRQLEVINPSDRDPPTNVERKRQSSRCKLTRAKCDNRHELMTYLYKDNLH